MKKFFTILVAILTFYSLQAQHPSEQNIDEIVKQLSIEEKINLVVGKGIYIPGVTPESERYVEKVPGAAGHSYAIDRLNLPSVVLADGPAGVRIHPQRPNDPHKYYATAFPIASLMASTWNVDLMQQVGQAFGNESKEFGVDILLAPALNIHRQPLTGRNFEYYSEDPFLSGKMAAAFVKGVQSEGVGSSIKHFAANNQETNRTTVNTIVDERAMREIYLKGFEIAVKEAHPWTVMSAYNKINGVYSSQRHDLLTSVLRNEWGYDGFVMTDWFAGDNAVEQMKAGNDLLMPGVTPQKEAIRKAIETGDLPMQTLNENVSRILKIYTQTLSFKGYKSTGKPNTQKHQDISREAASEGMVLLKNEHNTLPLSKEYAIALFGNASYATYVGGTGSGDVNNKNDVSIWDGFLQHKGITNPELAANYQEYIIEQRKKLPPKKFFFEPDTPIKEKALSIDTIQKVARSTDVAIFTLGRSSGEFKDRERQNDYLLSKTERLNIKLLSDVFHAQGKKLIVVLNIGGVIETASWKEYADAILIAWQPGQEAGNAVADVIYGDVNPSGKIPMTFPVKYEDHLASRNFPGKEFNLPVVGANNIMGAKPAEVKYEEGIFVGYRHFETHNVKTSYPFGFGLSYSTFQYSKLKIKQKGTHFEVSCTVRNTGALPGKEIVQLYISAPDSELPKPIMELKGFGKTKLLQPGEKQKISFTLSPKHLASYYTKPSAWIAEAGTYRILLASSVANIELEGKIEIEEDIITADVKNQFEEVELHLEEKERIHNTQKTDVKPLHPAKVYRNVEWANVKGLSLTMDIHVPETGKESYPVLVVYHGGGWLMNDNSIMEDLSKYISTHSETIVCNVNYRLLSDHNNTTLMNEIIEDAMGALVWIKENIEQYKGNASQIAVTGDSAGGHLASCILTFGRKLGEGGFTPNNTTFKPTYIPQGKTIADLLESHVLNVQAAIISYGAFDIYTSCKKWNFDSEDNFFWDYAGAEVRGIFGSEYTIDTHPDLYKAVSPLYNIPEATDFKFPPQLITVGSNDKTTPPDQVKAYFDLLKSNGHPAKMWVYENKPHAFLDSGSNEYLGIEFEKDAIEAIQVMIQFLDDVFPETVSKTYK